MHEAVIKPVGSCALAPPPPLHDTGPHHPERPDRLRAIHRAVRLAGLLDSPDPFPSFALHVDVVSEAGFKLRELPLASPSTEAHLQLIHPPRHIEYVRLMCETGGGVLDDGDTPVSPQSYDAALLSAGAVISCCDAVMGGQVRRAFAAVRPPGHHAEPARAMGFCLFSNVAIAARHLQHAHNLQRVAIVDFDVHHGNGTQACFYDDPTVLFVSLHQHPRTCYPGTGYEHETGAGPGKGFTLNIPIRPHRGDEEYLGAIEQRVIPALDAFAPQALLLSAGFDAHRDDPLAQMEVTESGFEQMTRLLCDAADRQCAGRVISALEGGYDLPALGRSVVRHLVGLASD